MQVNPEIRRNLWLEFSLHRLLAMPVILGLIFFVAAHVNHNTAHNVAATALVVYFCVIKLWGGHKAAGAVVDEVNDHTWDFQKLSAMSPWSLTWGKLFGSTLYTWYGGIMAFAAFIAAGYYFMPFDDLLKNAALFLLSGMIVHAAALLSSMSSVGAATGTHQKLRTIFHHVFGLIAGSIFAGSLGFNQLFVVHMERQAQIPPPPDISWYGVVYNLDFFTVVTGLLFFGWLVASLYGHMRKQMKMRTGPWLWAGFVIFWAAFLSGFTLIGPDEEFEKLLLNASFNYFIAFSVILVAFYFIVFEEPWTGVGYRRFFDAWKNKDYRKFFDLCPRWLVTFPLCIAAAIITGVRISMIPVVAQHQVMSVIFPSLPNGPPDLKAVTLFMCSLLCFAARDTALLHFFKLSLSSRRPKSTALFYMAILYLLLPFIFYVSNSKAGISLFVPLPGQFALTSASVFAQAMIAALLVVYKWRQYWRNYG